MRKMLALSLALLAVPAQPAPAEQWADIETVDVHAAPGPAVWHVTRGDSEVWILGTIGVMPKGLNWNRRYLADLFDGAQAVLMPPNASVGILEGTWLLITYGGKLSLPRGQALEATMPPEMRARFAAMRTRLGQDEDRYRTDTPIRAAMRLQQDFMKTSELTGSEPNDAIRKMARDSKATVKPVAQFDAAPLIKEALNLSLEKQNVCLAQVMDDVDGLAAHGASIAEFWSVGDLKNVKANFAESRMMNCLAVQTRAFGAMNENAMAAFATAIDAALNKPGKTIAVIGLANLLRKGGVLERLEARHLTIQGPKE